MVWKQENSFTKTEGVQVPKMAAMDFEKPITELKGKISELRNMTGSKDFSIAEEITRLEKKVERLTISTYSKLGAAQKVQVARHPERPHFLDYIKELIQDFTPLAGDRQFGEDHALIGGLRSISTVVRLLSSDKKKVTIRKAESITISVWLVLKATVKLFA
jgi:acetyl-CoA carboxylase alpha subunit